MFLYLFGNLFFFKNYASFTSGEPWLLQEGKLFSGIIMKGLYLAQNKLKKQPIPGQQMWQKGESECNYQACGCHTRKCLCHVIQSWLSHAVVGKNFIHSGARHQLLIGLPQLQQENLGVISFGQSFDPVVRSIVHSDILSVSHHGKMVGKDSAIEILVSAGILLMLLWFWVPHLCSHDCQYRVLFFSIIIAIPSLLYLYIFISHFATLHNTNDYLSFSVLLHHLQIDLYQFFYSFWHIIYIY